MEQRFVTTFFRYDLRASVTVFFVALPLCLGISLASGAPVYSGLIAGMVGGLVVSVFSRSPLSVSGPAAGLTAICFAGIAELHSLSLFFAAVSMAGILQMLLGILKLGGFTHFIPSAVIKGMLTAIGVILISKQIPLLLGYDRPDFWTNQLFNVFTLKNGFGNFGHFVDGLSAGAILVATVALLSMIAWKKIPGANTILPVSFVAVVTGTGTAWIFGLYTPQLELASEHYVNIPENIFSQLSWPEWSGLFTDEKVWTLAVIIAGVASLETLLSVEAIDKLDPYNRVTSQNRELFAQGVGNFVSGLLGGIPVTAVIVRSAANAEAGGRTRASAFMHGVWLLVVVLTGVWLVNKIPYSVLAVILIRTGYNLARPRFVRAVYKQGREQFVPFAVTVVAILLTDLLLGVLIGAVFSIYFLIKHTYRAGFVVTEKTVDRVKHYHIDLALNVSFLNKKRFIDLLDSIPEYSIVEIVGTNSVYIDRDILEIFQRFKSKAHDRHIQLHFINVPATPIVEYH